jgi:hypothetical protein
MSTRAHGAVLRRTADFLPYSCNCRSAYCGFQREVAMITMLAEKHGDGERGIISLKGHFMHRMQVGAHIFSFSLWVVFPVPCQLAVCNRPLPPMLPSIRPTMLSKAYRQFTNAMEFQTVIPAEEIL